MGKRNFSVLDARPLFEQCEPRLLLDGTWLTPVSLETGASGQYCDVAFRDDGNLAMVYYDPSPSVGTWDADLVYRYAEITGGTTSGATARLLETGDEGKWASIALGANNKAHISYYDVSSGDLRYVTRTGSWSSAVTVDSTGNVGEYTQIALDSGENPHILYYDRTNQQLKHAWYDGSWNTEAVATIGSVAEDDFPRVYHLASLAIDDSDTLHISFYDKATQDLIYGMRDGGGWSFQTVESDGNVGVENALALDSSGTPHIAYFDFTDTDIHYAVYNGSGWDIETVNNPADYAGEGIDMLLDGADQPHISYKDQLAGTGGKLGYAYKDDTGWHLSNPDSVQYTGQQTSLAMDAAGNAAVTYRKHYAYDKRLKLVYGTEIGEPQPAVAEAEVTRGIDYEDPTDAGDDTYEYEILVGGYGLSAIEVTSPWGENFDSTTVLTNWDGSYFEHESGDLWFEAYTEMGMRWLELGWDDLNNAQWNKTGTTAAQVSVTHTTGTWGGSVSLAGLTAITQMPTLTSPIYGQEDVSLTPTFQWDAFSSPPAGGGVYVCLMDLVLDEDIDDALLGPSETTWSAGPQLDEETWYELELDFANAGTQMVDGVDVQLFTYTETDNEFKTVKPGPTEIWVDRGIDINFPGAGDDAYVYWVEVAGKELTGLEVVTPWGETFDSASYLPPGWDGSYFEKTASGSWGELEFEAGTDNAERYLEFEWDGLTQTQWDALGTAAASLTVSDPWGSWSGAVDFGGAPIPSEAPNITAPAHLAVDVDLQPVFQWDQWTSPDPNDPGVWFELYDVTGDNDVYEEDHAPADTTSWTPAQPMALSSDHEFAVDFHTHDQEVVNDVDVHTFSWHESDVYFTTTATPPIPAPDLVLQMGLAGGGQVIPGDRVPVPITLSNIGDKAAVGTITLQLWASDDAELDGGDILAEETTTRINISIGASKDFTINLVIPPDAGPSEHYLIGTVIPDAGVGEFNTENNTDATGSPTEIVWKFGDFDPARKTAKLTVYGEDLGEGDVPVTFTLTGGGDAEIFGGDEFDGIVLKNTTAKSSLKIATKGRMWTSIGSIIIEGSLGTLDAKTAEIRGDVIVDGTLGKLILGNVDADHTISINDDGVVFDPAKMQLTVTLGSVADTDFDTHGIPIKSLRVVEWRGGTITAPWIGKIDSKGDKKTGASGDFHVSMNLDGSGNPKLTLGNVKVADDSSDGTWNITGDVGNITIADDLGESLAWNISGNVGHIKVGGDLSGVVWHVSGDVKGLRVGDDLQDSDLEMGGAVGNVKVGDEFYHTGLTVQAAKSIQLGEAWECGIQIGADLRSFRVGDLEGMSLEIHGDLKSIRAGDVSEVGIHVDGALGSFQAGDVAWSSIDAESIKTFKAYYFGDSNVEVDGQVGTFMVGDWDDSDLNAHSLKTLKADSFHRGRLNLSGQNVAPGKAVLNSARVGDITDSADQPDDRGWNIGGNVGSVAVGNTDEWFFNAMGESVKGLKLGQATNTVVEVDGELGAVSATSWSSGSISADSLKSIKTSGNKKAGDPGNFLADLNLAGQHVDPRRSTLGNVSIAGDLGLNAPMTVEWGVTGDAGAIRVRGDIWNWDLELNSSLKSLRAGEIHNASLAVDDAIGSIQAVEWDAGHLEADSVKSIKMTGDKKTDKPGDLMDVEILLSGENVDHTREMTLGSLSLAGWAEDSLIRVMGHVGKVNATALLGTDLLLGCSDVTGMVDDFEVSPGVYNEFTLKSLTLKGDEPDNPADPTVYFQDKSSVAAWNIDMLKFNQEPSLVDGSVEFHELDKAINVPTAGVFLIQV